MKARKILYVEERFCVGCHECELMCSLKKTGTFNIYRARLKVTEALEMGKSLPIICHHCRKPKCQTVCPESALSINPETGAVVLNETLCSGCLVCVTACPFGAIQVSPEGEILKCDLCGGDPTCVKYCSKRPEDTVPNRPNPRGAMALRYVEPHLITLSKRTDHLFRRDILA